jgi:hypothetical protein
MSDRLFSSLIPRLNTSVPGCPQPLMEQAIRDAAIKTCERTLYWRHAETPYNLDPGIPQYLYRKPAGSDVHAVFEALVNGSPLSKLTLEQATYQYPHWVDLYGGVSMETLWSTGGALNEQALNEQALNGGSTFQLTDEALEGASSPRAITQISPDQFIILPLPDDAEPYTIRLVYALKPSRSARGMPAYIFDELEDAIFHGALQTLLVLPNEAWGDRELASYHARQYLYAVTERRARANLGNVRGAMTVQMRPFA